MVLTKEKIDKNMILERLDELNQNMQRNSNNVEQLINFSNLMRRQRNERPICIEELNALEMSNEGYRYGIKKF